MALVYGHPWFFQVGVLDSIAHDEVIGHDEA
jgi:hypothetical protein